MIFSLRLIGPKILEGLMLELTVIPMTNDDKPLPDQERLIEQFMDHVYGYYNKAGALVQSVQVTAVNGEPVS